MERLNPAYKFLTILIVGIILSFSFNIRVNFGVFLLSVLMTLSSRNLEYKKFFFWLSVFALCALGFFMTGLLFSKNIDSSEIGNWGFATISVSSLETALRLSSRILAFGSLALLFSMTTRPSSFFHSLRQQFKIPAKFTYGVLAAYGFLPTIKNEYVLVRAAVSVRGVKAGPLSPRLLYPMLVRSFRRAENVAMAMESRGFNPKAERGEAFPVPLGPVDILFSASFVAAVVFGLIFL
ncbi:MAG: energy-coupling factor transporter transmembrane protein EcfT [Deltaproteobacteria bacterium]|jgi:energy-coupling factor transport system permease protein|nr:energy-coupling factor transporter transmembrane protein EcfT [Deltaproteobacteria bacterium]